MPNWAFGYVNVTGTRDGIKSFIERFVSEDDPSTIPGKRFFARSFIQSKRQAFIDEAMKEFSEPAVDAKASYSFVASVAWSAYSCLIGGYDEYELLMLAMGRCAQDDYYLVPINEKELPEEITRRFSKRIEDVLPLENHCLLVFFRDGVVKKCDLQKHFEKTKTFQVLLKKPDFFQYVQMQTGGYGVAWDVNMTISDTMLYRIGKSVPLTMENFRNFAAHRIINASEAAEILGCSRQNIIDLTKRGKLHPIKTSEKSTLYLKSEVLKRNWQ